MKKSVATMSIHDPPPPEEHDRVGLRSEREIPGERRARGQASGSDVVGRIGQTSEEGVAYPQTATVRELDDIAVESGLDLHRVRQAEEFPEQYLADVGSLGDEAIREPDRQAHDCRRGDVGQRRMRNRRPGR
jgi:hypothetical protein